MPRPTAVLAVLLAAGSVLAQPGAPPPVQVVLTESEQKKLQERADLAEALEFSAVVIDAEKDPLVREQAAAAIKELSGVRSWLVVVRLRTIEDRVDGDTRAAVTTALAALRPPTEPDELHDIIHSERGGVCATACAVLAKEFPAHEQTKWVLRRALRHGDGADVAAAKALKSLEPAKKPVPAAKPEK